MAFASSAVRAETPPPNLKECKDAADRLEQINCEGAGRARCLNLLNTINTYCIGAGQYNLPSRAATILKAAAQRDCTKSVQSLAKQIGTGTCRGFESDCDQASKICAEAGDDDARQKLAGWMGNGSPAPAQPANPTPPAAPGFPAAVVEKCQPLLEKLVDAVLDNKPGDARAIYQVRFLQDSDCRPYLTERAKAIGQVLPRPDDIETLVRALAPKVLPTKWLALERAKQEREQCRSTIHDFIEVLGQRRIRPELDKESENYRAADAHFEALRKTIVTSLTCHRLCFETPDCRTGIADPSEPVVVRLADGTCTSVLVEKLTTLEVGATILLTPAEVMRDCRSQIGAGPARPPETKATSCASWYPEARVDEVANLDQQQPQGTCSIRNLTSDQCTALGGTKFKPDNGSGFTECFRSVAPTAPSVTTPTVPTPSVPRIATPTVKPQQPSVTAPRPPAVDLSTVVKTPNNLCRAGTLRFVSATRSLSLPPARYCTDSDWNVRNVRAVGAQLHWTVPFTDGAVECSCTRSSGPTVQTPTVTAPNVRTPSSPTVTTPNVRVPTPTVRGSASCAATHPNARVDEIANTDQGQPRGTCSVRNLTPSECTAIGGHRFKPDSGSGFTECFFNARGAAPNPVVRNTPAAPAVHHWGAIAAGIDQGDRARVGVGIAWNHASQQAAEEAALAQCRSRANSCVVKDTFHGKGTCGYVTTGRDSEGRVGWGSGPTSARAHSNCEGEGLECQTPIGGCNQ